MSLDFCYDIQMVGSEFGIKNLTELFYCFYCILFYCILDIIFTTISGIGIFFQHYSSFVLMFCIDVNKVCKTIMPIKFFETESWKRETEREKSGKVIDSSRVLWVQTAFVSLAEFLPNDSLPFNFAFSFNNH